MALFKIFKGNETDLNSVPLHEGYAYFCEDTCNLWIDVSNEAGGRLQVNAYSAQVLANSVMEIDVDDIFLKTMVASVEQGGTGRSSLTVNALLVGNGIDPVKLVGIDEGAIVMGESTNGVIGLKGIGALFALNEGFPEFGTLPIAVGGTGGTTAEEARTNLEVYSKEEMDEQIGAATTLAYTTTLFVDLWEADGDAYKYTYSNTELTCGKNGDVPPIITYSSNIEDYNKLDPENTIATPGTGIVFKAIELPTADIGLIIVDNK